MSRLRGSANGWQLSEADRNPRTREVDETKAAKTLAAGRKKHG